MVPQFRIRFVTVLVCLLSVFATGCASKYGPQMTRVDRYPDCYQPIADLRQAEKNFNTTMVMSTTMGALLGAMIGASQTGKVEGALAGAAIGAGAGAGAGYLLARHNDQKDSRIRLASYSQDLNTDVSALDRASAAGRVAYECYSRRFREALADYQAKRITRAELDTRYAEIKSGLAEASTILGQTITEADKREAEYRNVLNAEAAKINRPIPAVQTVSVTPSSASGKKKDKPVRQVARKSSGDQLQDLSNGVGRYNESSRRLSSVKSELDDIQLQMDKVMLAQG